MEALKPPSSPRNIMGAVLLLATMAAYAGWLYSTLDSLAKYNAEHHDLGGEWVGLLVVFQGMLLVYTIPFASYAVGKALGRSPKHMSIIALLAGLLPGLALVGLWLAKA